MKQFPDTITSKRAQSGAIAIEFVFIFPVFFIICYAIIVYGLAFLVKQNLTYASEEILRFSIGNCVVEIEGEPEECHSSDYQQWLAELNPQPFASFKLEAEEQPTPICNPAPSGNGVICQYALVKSPIIDGISFPGFGRLPNLEDNLNAAELCPQGKLCGRASLLF